MSENTLYPSMVFNRRIMKRGLQRSTTSVACDY
jgi:hypothetical protein